jgi:hypothetical protein
MRYLQIVTVIIFIISLLFAGWANNRYYSSFNMDYPEISNSEETLQISVQDPPEAMFQGLSAQDATDGDLTDQILVASVSHFLEPGTMNVKYVVFDSHNNSDTLTRRVQYTDYRSPEFALEKAPVYTVGSSFDLLDYLHVDDCIDGDIGDNIRVISNMVNNYSEGNYPVVLEVSNSCGDAAQITLWVSYFNKQKTVDIKLHQYIVYVQQADAFDPQRWIASVTDRNGVALDAENIEIQGNLDVNKPGCYQLTYSYDDGKLTGQSPLTVVVTERQG